MRLANLFLGLLICLVLGLIALHWLGWINAWHFPLKSVAALLLGASLGCRGLAQWRRNKATSQPASMELARPRQHFGLGDWGLGGWRLRHWFLTLLLLLAIAPLPLSYAITHTCPPNTVCIGIPRPQNTRTPSDRNLAYTTVNIPVNSTDFLEAWKIETLIPPVRGTVILFPGHLGTKGNQLIPVAQSLVQLGYNTMLVDFQGIGSSSGNTVTVGMKEAKDVAAAFRYVQAEAMPGPVILYGVSMGSAAILRAIAHEKIQPDGIILELPFLQLRDAIASRFRYAKLPAFPFVDLLLFWASVQHGVNGFAHNPVEFAKVVRCPVLVFHGQQDRWVSEDAIKTFFAQFQEPKQLVIVPEAGHHQAIGISRSLWDQSLQSFLRQVA